jgi:tetratricopeptide (TPR) repeat protein
VAAVDIPFHFHPHYREQTPLEPVLNKREARFDDFVSEQQHDKIAAVLARWSRDLLASPGATQSIDHALASDFRGASMQASETKVTRSNDWLQIRDLHFPSQTTVARERFAGEFHSYLSDFTRLVTVEFQITAIGGEADGRMKTSVRYELVGSGAEFYREQRVGTWGLEWQERTSGEYLLTRWVHGRESRSRSFAPVFEDITVAAFGQNPSYSAQLVHGVDYWRTVLDGACRIDVYGHNGVSVGDIDGDGFDDVYLCQPAGLPNRLFRNRGDGTFEDITEASGTGILENTACALFADVRNSGVQDLIVVRTDGPVLLLNDGAGNFRAKPKAFTFAQAPQGTFAGAAAADYDCDGWLDIYFCLYVYYKGTNQYKYPSPYYDANNGPPNFLMRNDRDGTFRDVTAASGLSQNNTRYSFCCGWTDTDGNGWPDLYVANDFGKKNMYRNNGDGTFSDIADQAGVEDTGAGMSVCCFDYDNDGAQDLYVGDMWSGAGERIAAQKQFQSEASAPVHDMYRKHAMGNSLFRNRGDGQFSDATEGAGVGMGRWSWSSDAYDFDHDGLADLYVTNGMISGPLREDLNSFFWRQVVAKSPNGPKPAHDYEQGWSAVNELIRADYSWSGYERNVFYANNGDGTFSDVSGAIGLDFLEDGRAFVLADLDHDGRLELLLKSRNGPQLRLLRNLVKDLPPSISFRLRGAKSNRDAIGASVAVEVGGRRQMKTLQAGSGFLSQHSKELFFGLGNVAGSITAVILWPSGAKQTLRGLQKDSRILVEEGVDAFHSEPFKKPSTLPVKVAQKTETLPERFETWLLAPLLAPDFSLRSTHGATHTLSAFRGKCVLLHFCAAGSEEWEKNLAMLENSHGAWAAQGLQVIAVDLGNRQDAAHGRRFSFIVLLGSEDVGAIYNILYRAVFDRHRDFSFPTSLLLDRSGLIVKIYGGALNVDHVAEDWRRIPTSDAERIAQALPFSPRAKTFAFGRNYLSLGSVYLQRGYFDAAEPWFRLAVGDDPSSAEAHYGIGSVLLKQGKTAEALSSFERAAKLEANYPDTKPNAWNNLGLIAAQDGRTEDAIRFFSEALKWDPDYPIALLNLGNAYRQAKRWDAAETTLERALRLAPNDAEVNYSLGMVFAQTEQPDRAYAELKKALELRPNYPEAMNNLGVLYLRTRRRDNAVAEFEKCIRIAPAFDQSYLNLARVYGIEGDREKARATLLALLQQHPNHPQASSLLEQFKP